MCVCSFFSSADGQVIQSVSLDLVEQIVPVAAKGVGRGVALCAVQHWDDLPLFILQMEHRNEAALIICLFYV